MEHSLSSFNLPPHLLPKLHTAGYHTAQDFVAEDPQVLAKCLGVGTGVAEDLLATVCEASKEKINSTTAFTMFQEEGLCGGIVTFSSAVDRVLGGGIPIGMLTEIVGKPGTGKTLLCLQLCVDVQIGADLGGLAGEAVYIDTQGTFTTTRCKELCDGCIRHCSGLGACSLTLESLLSNIHYHRVTTYLELLAAVNNLTQFLNNNHKVRVVCVDSMAFQFKNECADLMLRTRLLHGITQDLLKLATKHNIAVVLTNELTTKVSGDNHSVSPSLGESWSHMCTVRCLLQHQTRHYSLTVEKAPHLPQDTAHFDITREGIRDVILTSDKTTHPAETNDEPNKRQRTN